MSILNMMFAGSGGGEFKVATPIATSSSSLSFSMEGEPVEYILMFVPANGISVSTSYIPAFICHTTSYDRYYRMIAAFGTVKYSSRTMSDVTTNYSSGVFTVSIPSGDHFHSSYSYALLYR